MDILSPTSHHTLDDDDRFMNRETDNENFETPKPIHDEEVIEIPPKLYMIFGSTFFSALASWTQDPMLLLYSNKHQWTTKHDVRYLSYLTIGSKTVELIMTPVYGYLVSNGLSFRWLNSVLATIQIFGTWGMVFAPNAWRFWLSYILCRCSGGTWGVRMSYTCAVVKGKSRTFAMSIFPLFLVMGALIGPIVDNLIDIIQGKSEFLFFGALIDVYRSIFAATSLFHMFNLLCSLQIEDVDINVQQGSSEELNELNEKNLSAWDAAAGSTHTPSAWEVDNAMQQQNFIMGLFLAVNYFISFIMGMVSVCFPAVVINIYGFSERDYATLQGILACIAIIPPLSIAYFSQIGVRDISILILGISMKVIGVTLVNIHGLLPFVVGGLLTYKASIFYDVSVKALSSKLISQQAQTNFQSWLSGAGALGYLMGNYFAGHHMLPWYGTILFSVFYVPIVGAFVSLYVLHFNDLLVPSSAKIQEMLLTLSSAKQ